MSASKRSVNGPEANASSIVVLVVDPNRKTSSLLVTRPLGFTRPWAIGCD